LRKSVLAACHRVAGDRIDHHSSWRPRPAAHASRRFAKILSALDGQIAALAAASVLHTTRRGPAPHAARAIPSSTSVSIE
jgi:hypothetical protein